MNIEGFRLLVSMHMYLEFYDPKACSLIVELSCDVEQEFGIPLKISNEIFDAMESKWEALGRRNFTRHYHTYAIIPN